MNNRELALGSIKYTRGLLNKFERVLNGASDSFSPIEIKDLIDITGLNIMELKELLNLSDSEIKIIEQL